MKKKKQQEGEFNASSFSTIFSFSFFPPREGLPEGAHSLLSHVPLVLLARSPKAGTAAAIVGSFVE